MHYLSEVVLFVNREHRVAALLQQGRDAVEDGATSNHQFDDGRIRI